MKRVFLWFVIVLFVIFAYLFLVVRRVVYDIPLEVIGDAKDFYNYASRPYEHHEEEEG